MRFRYKTDRQTDIQTNTFLIASPCWHSMQFRKKPQQFEFQSVVGSVSQRES